MAREHYYLQLRANVLRQALPQLCPLETCVQLAAVALQADRGDAAAAAHHALPLEAYLPQWVRGRIVSNDILRTY